MAIPKIKKIDLSKYRVRRRRLTCRKLRYSLDGGPVTHAWLCTPGTLIFSVGEFRGFYDSENKWVQI